MGCAAERAVDRRTGEGWRGMQDEGKVPVGGGSAGDTQTWQAQILRVRNTCVY